MRPGKPSSLPHLPGRASAPGLPSPPILGAGGLRERKKAKTRQQLSDVATRMFMDRGFDEVTVAEVAAEAGVSVKTVFNYFGSKEDLLFDREPEFLRSIDGLLASRAPGRGLIRVLQADVAERWPALEFGRWALLTDDTIVPRRAFYQLIGSHAGLQARRLQMAERLRDRMAAGIAEEFEAPDSAEASAAATLIHAAYDSTGRELYASVLAGAPAATVVERARRAGLEALSAVERAYAGTSLVEGPAAH